MLETLEKIRTTAIEQIVAATDTNSLEQLRIEYLGRKGQLTQLLRQLGTLSSEERPLAGKLSNEVKIAIQCELTARITALSAGEKGKVEFDYSLPGRRISTGRRHPVNQTIDELIELFTDIGLTVAEGSLIEDESHNIDALNTPADHPARDEKDTLYLRDYPLLLRTETSTVQIRTMEHTKPPIRIIAPGRCYRNDTADARHYPVFHQIEGLWVDEGISFAHLKGVLLEFARGLLGQETNIRLRPHFFPFTEPSAEMEATCPACNGAGCRVCSNVGWLELGGAGMVDPQVLDDMNIDSEKYTGFAFGFGPERLTMVRHGITDIRNFYNNDLRFLRQFQ